MVFFKFSFSPAKCEGIQEKESGADRHYPDCSYSVKSQQNKYFWFLNNRYMYCIV